MTFLPNGIYTLKNPEGEHLTFKIYTKRGGKYKGTRQISLMVGPNIDQLRGFAFIDEDRNSIYLFRKCRSRTFECYRSLLERAHHALESLPDKENAEQQAKFVWLSRTYEVLRSKKCMKCNRTLTDPESIKLGIGPVCRGDKPSRKFF